MMSLLYSCWRKSESGGSDVALIVSLWQQTSKTTVTYEYNLFNASERKLSERRNGGGAPMMSGANQSSYKKTNETSKAQNLPKN